MVEFSLEKKEILIKVVYYGPALSGKTTNLQTIHKKTDPQNVNKLIQLNTKDDRTLFFDMLPFDLGYVGGYRLRLQLYTVPGQVQYMATRKIALNKCDGVVFVANSEKGQLKANQASLRDLEFNLRLNRIDINNIPLVLQLNKQDLTPLTPRKELEERLRWRDWPVFLSIATENRGVFETLISILHETIKQIFEKLKISSGKKVVDEIERNIVDTFSKYIEGERLEDQKAGEISGPGKEEVFGLGESKALDETAIALKKLELKKKELSELRDSLFATDDLIDFTSVKQGPDGGYDIGPDSVKPEDSGDVEVLRDDDLEALSQLTEEELEKQFTEKIVESELKSGLETVNMRKKIDSLMREMDWKSRQLTNLGNFSDLLRELNDAEKIHSSLIKLTQQSMSTNKISIVLWNRPSKQLEAVPDAGQKEDPLCQIKIASGKALSDYFLEFRHPIYIKVREIGNATFLPIPGDELMKVQQSLEDLELTSFAVMPMYRRQKIYGLFIVYFQQPERDSRELDASDLEFLNVIVHHAMLAIDILYYRREKDELRKKLVARENDVIKFREEMSQETEKNND
jgi:signal recognition particle receptor subunit beta